MALRIAVGGFQHETNSFAPSNATFEDFVRPGGWPGLLHGDELFDGVAGINLPIAGFIKEAGRRRAALIPLLWASAEPSGPVTDHAYERIVAMLLSDLASAGPVDAVYLDLHGAMVTEGLEDGEGELLRRVRAIVGKTVPIVVSLDLHANVTRAMVDHSDLLLAFRTYPHVDMADIGARAAQRLIETTGKWDGKAFRQLPYLIPITAQCTLSEPMAGFYRLLEQIEGETGADLSFTPGFPPADITDCGPAIFASAPSQAQADQAVERLTQALLDAEPIFARERVRTVAEGVTEAVELARSASRPIILADTQDNPGAGSSSDTTGLLRALLDAKIENAALGLFYDPEAALACHKAGVGAKITLDLGGKGTPGDSPLHVTGEVRAIGDGVFAGSGPMWEGSTLHLGPMAALRVEGVDIAIGSIRQQPSTQAIFRHVGIDPTAARILVLKSSVHFRADFQPIAEQILVVAAPGLNAADPAALPYTRLRASIRRKPQA
ncbi:M81 family metallopeptidase [Lacibacterium aquatile]|uniref:Microcystinase C n=1 Tax=Lacibacterium aquatile TaxID=1168082 RepID=A0ABW5DPS6_9PROT